MTQKLNAAGEALVAPLREDFLKLLSAGSGLAFVGGSVADLAGEPLQVGDVILDSASGEHCIVLDAERAVRQGYTAWRKNGCWQRVTTTDRYLTVTRTEAGVPVCISWQDEDHQILDVIFSSRVDSSAAAE